ncbi:MAG: hypothetical protein RhofKO_09270 [Rhodothermales bacterium]
MVLTYLDRYRDVGLLIIRLGLGLTLTFVYGLPKVLQGPDGWVALAAAGGIGFAQVVFGFLGAMSEFLGGILLAIGFLFRPTLFFLFCTMLVATYSLYSEQVAFTHPLELAIIFVGLFLTGPGRHSLDARFTKPTA